MPRRRAGSHSDRTRRGVSALTGVNRVAPRRVLTMGEPSWWGASGKEGSLLFLEKKKQKDLARLAPNGRAGSDFREQGSLVLSFKKELLAFLLRQAPPRQHGGGRVRQAAWTACSRQRSSGWMRGAELPRCRPRTRRRSACTPSAPGTAAISSSMARHAWRRSRPAVPMVEWAGRRSRGPPAGGALARESTSRVGVGRRPARRSHSIAPRGRRRPCSAPTWRSAGFVGLVRDDHDEHVSVADSAGRSRPRRPPMAGAAGRHRRGRGSHPKPAQKL